MVRKAAEEAGLVIKETDLELVHTVHVLDSPGSVPCLELFFRAHQWEGEPRLLEPDCCTQWAWWPLNALPEPLVPYTRGAIEAICQGTAYSEAGWPQSPSVATEGPR